jgi:hypothetical protein
MKHAVCSLIISMLSAASAGAASAPPFRAASFLHVCERGTNSGNVCKPILDPQTDPDFCPGGGTCELVLRGKKANLVLTLIADDDVRNLTGIGLTSGRVVALTALVETRGALFTNTYQALDATSLAALLASLSRGPGGIGPLDVDEEFVATELSDQANVEFDLLYTGGAQFFGFGTALKTHFGITGAEVPVLTKVGRVQFFDRRGDGLGTAIRVRMSITFLELSPL